MATITEGGLVRVSRGMPHTFATTPDSPAHFLALHTPGGFEEFLPCCREGDSETTRQRMYQSIACRLRVCADSSRARGMSWQRRSGQMPRHGG